MTQDAVAPFRSVEPRTMVARPRAHGHRTPWARRSAVEGRGPAAAPLCQAYRDSTGIARTLRHSRYCIEYINEFHFCAAGGIGAEAAATSRTKAAAYVARVRKLVEATSLSALGPKSRGADIWREAKTKLMTIQNQDCQNQDLGPPLNARLLFQPRYP